MQIPLNSRFRQTFPHVFQGEEDTATLNRDLEDIWADLDSKKSGGTFQLQEIAQLSIGATIAAGSFLDVLASNPRVVFSDSSVPGKQAIFWNAVGSPNMLSNTSTSLTAALFSSAILRGGASGAVTGVESSGVIVGNPVAPTTCQTLITAKTISSVGLPTNPTNFFSMDVFEATLGDVLGNLGPYRIYNDGADAVTVTVLLIINVFDTF